MEGAAKMPRIMEKYIMIWRYSLAAGDKAAAVNALKEAVRLNPKLAAQASQDNDLASLRGEAQFEAIINPPENRPY